MRDAVGTVQSVHVLCDEDTVAEGGVGRAGWPVAAAPQSPWPGGTWTP
jgi:hypothetical protein